MSTMYRRADDASWDRRLFWPTFLFVPLMLALEQDMFFRAVVCSSRPWRLFPALVLRAKEVDSRRREDQLKFRHLSLEQYQSEQEKLEVTKKTKNIDDFCRLLRVVDE